MTTSKPLTVVIFENSSNDDAFQVRDALKKSFCSTESSVTVNLRSSNIPGNRFCYAEHTVFVLFKSKVTETPPLASYLKEHSSCPVLVLSLDNPPSILALEIAKVCSLTCESVQQAVGRAMQASRQAALVRDAYLQTNGYLDRIADCFDNHQQITGDAVTCETAERKRGKVRDRWEPIDESANKLALVTTDRQSGFDRQLAVVPYKGAVLNLCSQFWFEQTCDIIPNHLISTPHPSVSIVRRCQPFPIEFVVRSYMTGSTSTSIWKNYSDMGVRVYCGHALPDGMTKNQKLGSNILTPTTKEEDHDRPISEKDIVAEKWMSQEDLDVCGKAALAVFARGQKIAAEHGLILVDTKYEFGRCCETGQILLIDEVHTPDSSRYWLASSAASRIAEGLEPENIDKEFLRLWFRDQCDPYKDASIPDAPKDLVLELSRRYIQLYEMITGSGFNFESATTGEPAISTAIQKNIV